MGPFLPCTSRTAARARPARVLAAAAVAGSLLAACSTAGAPAPTAGDVTKAPPASVAPTTVTLLTHDSFSVDKALLESFRQRTGITVKVVTGGDAGEVVNKAVLTAGNPEGDVLFGVDNTLLSRAVGAGTFAPYRPAALAQVDPSLRALVPGDAVVPVDFGDVCVVADDSWFAGHGVAEPTSMADLADPRYRGRLVVENPATSSPGLAFLLATVARYGSGGWQDFWTRLRANGVKVDDGWTNAYDSDFTGGGQKGTYPLVVSYGTDPVASIEFADPKPTRPTVSVLADSCFRQVEFAGVLAGTRQPQAARMVVDFLLSAQFQAGIPLSMYVFPAVGSTALPPVFSQWAVQAQHPLTVAPAEITKNREQWVEQWTQTVLH
ncbi:MAG: thiamine ABC transporter substrate binding subunit [Actinomycetes bacterium]